LRVRRKLESKNKYKNIEYIAREDIVKCIIWLRLRCSGQIQRMNIERMPTEMVIARMEQGKERKSMER
jgi:hypothetical protein